MSTNDIREGGKLSISRLLAIALWFGLTGGLLEGAFLYLFQWAGWLGWAMQVVPVDANILWLSPLVNALLFASSAVLLAPLFRLTRSHWQLLAVGLYGTLAFYSLLSVNGRIREYAAGILALGLGCVAARWANRHSAAMARTLRSAMLLAAATVAIWLLVLGANAAIERVRLANLPPAPAGKPSVLFIVLDTLRADRVQPYGYTRPTTPFLNEFAEQAVLFENAFANSSWTLPSHASMFTGRLPYEHGATTWPYDGRFPTLAEVLAERGYATVGIAGNGIICTRAFGLSRGFIHWENIFYSPADGFLRTVFGRKIERFVLSKLHYDDPLGRMPAEEVNQRFLRWLDGRPDRPFFAFLNYMDAHEPYFPRPEYAARFTSNPQGLSLRGTFGRRPRTRPSREEARSRLNDAHDAQVAYLDDQLRQLFEQIRRRGLDQNLLVIITSDHGNSLGEHDLVGHRSSLYLEQVRVPLIIDPPWHVTAALRVPQAVGLENLPATVGGQLGLEPALFPGSSLAGCWQAASCNQEGAVIAELDGGKDFPLVGPTWPIRNGWLKSVATAKWHYILQQDGTVQLYAWPKDPTETQNLATTPEGQQVVADLQRVLQPALQATKAAGSKASAAQK